MKWSVVHVPEDFADIDDFDIFLFLNISIDVHIDCNNSVVPARLWVNQNDGDLNNVFTFEAADHDLQPIS